MYSLLVWHEVRDGNLANLRVSRSRFLEYTEPNIAAPLRSLSEEATACLKSWPCVLMDEGRGEEAAVVARITDIRHEPNDICIATEPLHCLPALRNISFWRLRQDLDIAQFEFNRNHFAVKNSDLFSALGGAGYDFHHNDVDSFQTLDLPVLDRTALVAARKIIAEWSHAEIDTLLLEAGVEGLSAERSLGDPPDRATAIIQFAVDHPWVVKADNRLFSTFLSSRASDTSSSTVGPLLDPAVDMHASGNEEAPSNRVFVVHGHNQDVQVSVTSFLMSLGLDPIILHKKPNMGRHLLKKFTDEAKAATFAVILMTDDDLGSRKSDPPRPRARQNVILELGYFLAHLGQDRVCALISPGLETPSDFDGVAYVPIEGNQQWKEDLRRELVAAKMPLGE